MQEKFYLGNSDPIISKQSLFPILCMTDSYTSVWPQWIAVTAAPLQEPVKDFGENSLVAQEQPQTTD